ncbi:MAG: fluoride efflux transporter CrcB [Kofleriaceae bacterium]|nr:fluoride efflux transporter CrcB [Myxococcales bacterium]MCB9559831.1 fluoride efflux transporter CrcB [Kofleriaceae bacterium]MCB9571442.1 fluoride efflux transporter CrcB [Kofleriaceae bacterium]
MSARVDAATAVGVALAGAAGSLCRWLVAVWMAKWPRWPWGTLAVNVVGALLIGGVVAALAARGLADSRTRIVITSGFMGGFTTFSAFAFETVAMLERRQVGSAALYVIVTVLAGIAAAWLGLAGVRALR